MIANAVQGFRPKIRIGGAVLNVADYSVVICIHHFERNMEKENSTGQGRVGKSQD